MNVVLVDAYDSFVYTIDHYLRTLGLTTTVLRRDDPRLHDALARRPAFLVLGPGPGRPEGAGYLQLLHAYQGKLPILGVCLGHQAIAMAFGGTVVRAQVCMHGKTSTVINDGLGVFTRTAGRPITAARYHSLVVSRNDLPDELIISGYASDDNQVMGIRHRTLPIEGVQFHPESIATDGGVSIFASFIDGHVPTTTSHRSPTNPIVP